MELKGILKEKLTERSGVSQQNGNPWRRAYYLLETIEMYPKKVYFEVRDGLTSRIAHFDTFIGKEVIIHFDINAHEFQGRWYNQIEAWGIKLAHPEEKEEEKKEDTAAAAEPAATDAEDGSVDWEGMKP